eukprot:scaffold7707_cov58-Attheya_sp.AAC.2
MLGMSNHIAAADAAASRIILVARDPNAFDDPTNASDDPTVTMVTKKANTALEIIILPGTVIDVPLRLARPAAG